MADESSGFGALRRELHANGITFATESTNRDAISNVVAELHLSSPFVDLYIQNGPAPNSAIPWVVEELQIFSIREISAAQEGYRWTTPHRERLGAWPNNWVVIASVFGDPFIVDVGDPAMPIYFARHGAGAWNTKRIAPTLTDFIEVLTQFESVLLNIFNQDVWDDSGLRPEFMTTLEDQLARMLPPADLANFLSTLD